MTIGDQIKNLVRQTVSEIRTIRVDKIFGASGLRPARLEFTVDGRCLYNGVEIGSGSGTGTTPGSVDGELSLWMKPTPVNKYFKYAAWGVFSAISLPSSVVEHAGLYTPGYYTGKCSFVTVDKLLPTNHYAAVVFNSDSSKIIYSGNEYLLVGTFGSAWAFIIDEITQGSIRAHLTKDSNTVASDILVNANSDYVYMGTMGDGTTNFPCVAVHVGNTMMTPETNSVEIKGGFAIDTAVAEDVTLDKVGVFLSDPWPVDMQDKQLILSDGSFIQDTGDGTLVIDGDVQTRINADTTTTIAFKKTEIVPSVPINMGGVAITSGKSSFAANELPNLSYIQALIATSTPPVTWDSVTGKPTMFPPIMHYHNSIGTADYPAVQYVADGNRVQVWRPVEMYADITRGCNIYNAGNKIAGFDNTLPYFPAGIVFGTDPTSTQYLSMADKRMYYNADTGHQFNTSIFALGGVCLNSLGTSKIMQTDGGMLFFSPTAYVFDKSIHTNGYVFIGANGSEYICSSGGNMYFASSNQFWFNKWLIATGGVALNDSGLVGIKAEGNNAVVHMPSGGFFILQVT